MALKQILFAKPVIILVILFTLISLSMDQIFTRFIIMQEEISNESKLNRLITQTDPLEIPVFGSSKARSAFIPDSLGHNVYNYGMEKCGFDVINFLLAIELKKEKNTPIIIEYNHRSFISAPEHTINMSTYLPNLEYQEVRSFLEGNDRMEARFELPGLRYFGFYFQYLRYYLKRNSGSSKMVSRGGNFADLVLSDEVFNTLVENRMQRIAQREKLQYAETHTEAVISAGQRNELKALKMYLDFTADSTLVSQFKLLVEANPERTFFLVYTPQHWSELKGISNLDVMRRFYKALDHDYPNLNVIDLSTMEIPDSGYKNTAHLNLSGAMFFSKELARKLHKSRNGD